MQIKEVKEEIWESFLLEFKDKTFLNSWDWGIFQEKMGNKIWRLGVYNNNDLAGLALVVKVKAKRGTFLLIQHGPVILQKSRFKILEILLNELKELGKREKAVFIRMNPLWERTKENQEALKNLGFREAPMHANAYESTWKLDISISEEDLLKNMRKTTRYLIRQAAKNPDISTEKSEDLNDIEVYQKLNEKVAKRQRFVPFSLQYIKNEFEVFLKNKKAVLFFGKHKEEVVAAALMIFWSGVCFYHQAASNSKFAKLSAPYLIQWEAIKEAKRRNCKMYDFWGYIDPKKEPNHPWAGPTLFKMGFGGKGFEYIKTKDYPLSKKYYLIYLFERLRQIKRGL